MGQPFNALVSQVMNNVSNTGRIDSGLLRRMVGDQLVQMRAKRIKMYASQGKQVAMTPFLQTLASLPVEVGDFSFGGTLPEGRPEVGESLTLLRAAGLPTERLRRYVRLPQLISHNSFIGGEDPMVEYLGPPNGLRPLQVFTGPAYQYLRFRRVGAFEPYVCILGTVGWLFNCDALASPEFVGRMVLADPRQAPEFGGIFDGDETPFTSDDAFELECVQELTNQDISMYGRREKQALADGTNQSDN